MEHRPSTEEAIDAVLSLHQAPPKILRKDGSALTAGEQRSLVLRSENYTLDNTGLERLDELLSKHESQSGQERFWGALKVRARHPLVPWFLISRGKVVYLLEWILDEMERNPSDEQLILRTVEALKIEHVRYSVQELEEVSSLIGTLMTQSHFSGGERSLSARKALETNLTPNYMQTMRAQRNIYKALGTLREVVQGALYQRLEGMLSDI
ncbi:MAG: hypothetical protein ACE5HC_05970 [Candidatus Binatia bacterium]